MAMNGFPLSCLLQTLRSPHLQVPAPPERSYSAQSVLTAFRTDPDKQYHRCPYERSTHSDMFPHQSRVLWQSRRIPAGGQFLRCLASALSWFLSPLPGRCSMGRHTPAQIHPVPPSASSCFLLPAENTPDFL